jgi:hypothetical protein
MATSLKAKLLVLIGVIILSCSKKNDPAPPTQVQLIIGSWVEIKSCDLDVIKGCAGPIYCTDNCERLNITVTTVTSTLSGVTKSIDCSLSTAQGVGIIRIISTGWQTYCEAYNIDSLRIFNAPWRPDGRETHYVRIH